MKYYEDLLQAGEGQNLIDFVRAAINSYKSDTMYNDAVIAYEYFRKRNITIGKYQKLLYKMNGEAVPDIYSANHKLRHAFFPIFVKQENSFLLGNGITFNESGTKDKLGGNRFDNDIYAAGEAALWGAVSYLFFNLDHLEVFKSTEYAPLFGEEDGAMHAGIRWWQIDTNKPLRATLYEEDGYTDFIWKAKDDNAADDKDATKGMILHEKRPYVQIVEHTQADGDVIRDGKNYPGFPIVPLWANKEHQSEFTGLQEQIDAYDLISSGACNTIDEASLIFWTISNAGGMDDIDIAQFLERLRTLHAATVDDEGAKAESHTINVPYQASESILDGLRTSLYRDAMALDTDKLSAGNVTATAIETSYQNLELKCDGFEYCVTECIKGLLELIGVDDDPTYDRRKTTNQPEITQMVLSAAQYLDDETILKKLPFLNIDEIQDIMIRKTREEAARFAIQQRTQQPPENEDEIDG